MDGIAVRLKEAELLIMDTPADYPPHPLTGRLWRYTVCVGSNGEHLGFDALPTPADLAAIDRLYPTLGEWAHEAMESVGHIYTEMR